METLSAVNRLLGTVLGLAIVALLAVGGWVGYRALNSDRWQLESAQEKLAEKQTEIDGLRGELGEAAKKLTAQSAQIDELNRDLEAKRRAIQRLETAVRLLKVDHRVARIDVVKQQGAAAADDLTTTFRFVELGGGGKPLDEPRVLTVAGDVIYLDAWVVKFSDELVEAGDPLRATSVCLFRRIFGERQQPKDGHPIDPVGARPAAYRTGETPSDFERDLWTRFWDYANNPAQAREAGVRAAHGEAPSIKLAPGKSYKVLLRASGGLTIVNDDEAGKRPPL